MLKHLLISAAFIGIATASHAQAHDHEADLATPHEMHMTNKIIFLSGGIGNDEQALMKEEASKYNTRMSFARFENSGYITGAKVTLLDSKGNILLNRVSDGPYFYIALPEGKYTLKASYMGVEKTKELNNTSPKYDSGIIRFAWKDNVKLLTQQ